MNIARIWWIDGVLSWSTPSCGCCAEYHEDDGVIPPPPLEELAKFVELEEARVSTLRNNFDAYVSEQENG